MTRSLVVVAAVLCGGLVLSQVTGVALAAGIACGAGIGLAALMRLPRHLASAWAAWRLGWDRHLVLDIASALLDTLCELEHVQTPRDALDIGVAGEHLIRCHLAGATPYESDQFIGCLQELLTPPDNPRYLLERRLHRLRRDRRDAHYHAVPKLLTKKAQAQVLARHWRRRIGPVRVIYTRSSEGRRALLWARARAWTLEGQSGPARVNCWR